MKPSALVNFTAGVGYGVLFEGRTGTGSAI